MWGNCGLTVPLLLVFTLFHSITYCIFRLFIFPLSYKGSAFS